MDRWALAMGNFIVGNLSDAAALEWAVGGGSLRFESDTTIALTGADAEAAVGGGAAPSVGPGGKSFARAATPWTLR